MAVIRRRNKKQFLADIPTLISEEGIDSKYFQIFGMPEELPTGKSSFIVGGSPFLKSGVKLKIEIIDSQGGVVYTEPVYGYRDGVNRRVSIEIYDTKQVGEAILTLLGEIDPVKSDVPIPTEWQGVYNVKYTRRLSINPTLLNVQPIRFHKQPYVNIVPLTNAFKEYIQQPEETRILTAELASSKTAGTSTQTTDVVTQEESYPVEEQAEKAFDYMALYNSSAFKQSSFSNFRMPFTFQSFSPPTGNANLIVSSGSLDDGMIGENIIINDPQVDTTSPDIPTTYTVPSQYSSSILDITNDTTLNLAKAFYVTGDDGSTKYPVNLSSNQSFTCSFSPVPTEQDSVINYFDLADIRLSRLRTFSGDVKYVRVFGISQGSQTEQQFDFLGEFPLESQELLFDYNNIKSGRTGFFFNQSKINSYWNAYGGNRATTASGSGEPADSIQLAQTGSIIRYAMDISGSNADLNQEIMAQTSHSFSLSKNVPYELSFKVYGSRTPKTTSTGDTNTARIDFLISGSDFKPNHEFGGTYGRRILSIDFDDSDEYPELRDLQSYDWNKTYLSGMFIPLTSGVGKLQIRASSGRWHVSDVSLRPAADTNFSPEEARIFSEMPPSRNRPETVKFLLEFVNNDGKKADAVIISPDVVFPGANFAIQGDNNILSGSLFISNAIGEGIEMAGVSSAFLRTIGWEGFISASSGTGKGGFFLYSGSALSDAPDDYMGAGLEIHDGRSGASERYFQFKTQHGASSESIFRVKTDDYLFGISGSGGVESYISGADGNLEVSSSNFAISNTGNVSMTGTVTATAGNIGDWTISGGDIVGSNITMDADGSRIYKTDSNNDMTGYYMDFTPGSNYYVRFGTDFAVSSSGTLIASGAIIEGVVTASEGYIANWTIAPNTINKRNLGDFLYTGMSSTGDARFFAGAANLNAGTSSAVFNVKSDGTVSASAGWIGGWSLENSRLYYNTAANHAVYLQSNPYSSGGQTFYPGLYILSSSNAESLGDGGVQLYYDTDQSKAKFYVGDGSNKHLKFDGTDVDIKSAKFELDADNIEISSTHKSMSLGEGAIKLVGATTSTVSVGSTSGKLINITGSSDRGIINTGKESLTDTTAGFWLANVNGTPQFNVGDSTSFIKYTGTDMTINSRAFELSASNLEISSTNASMSIGPATSPYILLDGTSGVSANESYISVGSHVTRRINISGSAIAGVINTGKESVNDTTSGFWLANVGGNVEVNIGDSTNFMKLASGDFTLNVDALDIDATDIEVSSTQASASFGHDTDVGTLVLEGAPARLTIVSGSIGNTAFQGNTPAGGYHGEILKIGDITDNDGGDKFGLMMFDGKGIDVEDNRILSLGDRGNVIGGWEITKNQIRGIPDAGVGELYGTNEVKLILQSTGSLETSNFVSGLMGWRISSEGNGTAEFENMRIRGTLRTTVFEKESVNVVGGQLMVANSTTIQALKSGSFVIAGAASMSAASTTMSVENVSGFSRGEVLKVKSITDTGFSMEYMTVTGSMRYTESGSAISASLSGYDLTTIDPDGLYGEIYVGRAVGQGEVTKSIATTTSESISLLLDNGRPTLGATDIIYVNNTGSLLPQTVIEIDDERMKITAVTGSIPVLGPAGQAQSGSLYVIRDWHDTVPSIHNHGSSVSTVKVESEFLAGLVSTAQEYSEGQVIVSTGKFAQGTNFNDAFGYSANTSDAPNANGEYRLKSAAGAHLTTLPTITTATQLEIYNTDRDSTSRDNFYSLFDKGSYIVLLVDGTKEWVRFVVNGNPSKSGNVHTFPIKLNQDFYNAGASTSTTSLNVDFWFMSNIQDVSSGYLLMNANPNDLYSPYLDIVERTGSGVYDLQLRARLGDLSGLSSGYLYGDEEPGFGLYTDNGYFRGTIQAMTGSIHGILNIATTAGGIETGDKIMMGRNVDGSSDGIRIDGSNYWYTTGAWRVGGATNYLSLDNASGGNIDIAAETFRLRTSTFIISSSLNSGTLRMGQSAGPSSATDISNTGSYFDGTGNFAFVAAPDQYMRLHTKANSAKVLEARLSELNLVAGNMTLSGSTSSYIKVGTLQSVSDIDGVEKGFWVDNSGNMLLKGSTAYNDYIQVGSGSAVTIKTSRFDLETTGLDILGTSGSGASNKIRMGAVATNNDTSYLGTSTGFYVDGGGGFKVGDATNFIRFDGSSTIEISSDSFNLSASNLDISSPGQFISLSEGKIYLDGANNIITVGSSATKQIRIVGGASSGSISFGKSNVDSTIPGFWLANNNTASEFHLGDSAEYIKFDGDALSIKSADIDITATTFDLNAGSGKLVLESTTPRLSLTDNTAYLQIGSLTDSSTPATTNKGVFMTGGGSVLIKATGVVSEEYLMFNSGSGLTINTSDFILKGGTTLLLDTDSIAFDTSNASSAAIGTGTGFFANTSGDFRAGSQTDYIKYSDVGGLDIKTAAVNISSSNIEVSTRAGGVVRMGRSGSYGAPVDMTQDGIFMSGSGEFSFQTGSTYIKSQGGDLTMQSANFALRADGTISASDAVFGGTVYATAGQIGTTDNYWEIKDDILQDKDEVIKLNSTDQNISLSTGAFYARIQNDMTPFLNLAGGAGVTAAKTVAAGSSGSYMFQNAPGNIASAATNTSDSSTWTNPVYMYSTSTTDLGAGDAVLGNGGTTDFTANKTYTVEVGIRANFDHALSANTNDFSYSVQGTALATYTLEMYDRVGNLLKSWGERSNQGIFLSFDDERNPQLSVTTTYTATVNLGTEQEVYFKLTNPTLTSTCQQVRKWLGTPKDDELSDITTKAQISAYKINLTPSSNVVEVTPKGVQGVFVSDDTLETSPNTFFVLGNSESEIMRIQGVSQFTGSLSIKKRGELSSPNTVNISPGTDYADISAKNYNVKADGALFLKPATAYPKIAYVWADPIHCIGFTTGTGGTDFQMGDSTDDGNFHAANNIIAYTSTALSDIRLKENIKPLENNLDKVLQLSPSSFTWKVRDKQDDIGLIAQAVELVIPELVSDHDSIGKTKEFLGGDTHKTLDYAKLTTILIGAIQEQQKQIDELKQKLEEL